MILHPYFFPFDPNPCCPTEGGGPTGGETDPLNVVIQSDCSDPIKVEICANSAGDFDPILICDEATGLPIVGIVSLSPAGIPSTILYNLDGSVFTGTPAACSTADLELKDNLFCVDGVEFSRVDIIDPASATPVTGSFWQDQTGAIVADPTGTATDVKAGACKIEEIYVGDFCYEESSNVALEGETGTLPNGTTYTITGADSFSSSGETGTANTSPVVVTFSSPVDLTIGEGSLPFWQENNSGDITRVVTTGDNLDASGLTALDVFVNGQTAEDESFSNSGTLNWGNIIAPNTTQVTINTVDADSFVLTVAVNVDCIAYGIRDNQGEVSYFDKITNASVDASAIKKCEEEEQIPIEQNKKCYERPISLVNTNNVEDTAPLENVGTSIQVTPNESGKVPIITVRVDNIGFATQSFQIDLDGATLQMVGSGGAGLTPNTIPPGRYDLEFATPPGFQVVAGQTYAITATNGANPDLSWTVNASSDNGQVAAFGSGEFAQLVFETPDTERFCEVSYSDGSVRYFDYLNNDIAEIPADADQAPCNPIETACFVPVGVCKCYGDENASSAEYINPDNNTDVTFSHNSDTIKWESDGSDGSDVFTLAIVACIDSGNVANLTMVGANGVNTTFAADSILGNGNGDGTGAYAFGGVGPGSFSDKLREAYLACGDEAGASEACKYENCETGEVIWKDVFTDEILTVEQESTLRACVVPVQAQPECEESTIQNIRCAAENVTDPNAGTVSIGEQVLFITKVDCENTLTSSRAYLVSSGDEITGTILTDDCDPQPDVETVRSCIEDVDKVQWTQIAIIDPDTGLVSSSLYYDQNLVLGTPAGDPSEWQNCATFTDVRDIKLCEKNAGFLLLVDSGGVFARYSFFTETWEQVDTLSVPSAGGSADVENFRLYNFVSPDQLTTVDVNTDTQLPNITLVDGVINPAVATNPKTFSAASFRDSNGRLYAWDTAGADAGLYSIDVSTGAVDFVTTVTGVSGTGTSILIDNTTDTLYISGTNTIYEVDWTTGAGTAWSSPPIRPNGATFDTAGNAYVTAGNDTYVLPVGSDPSDSDNWTQIIDDFTAGANSLAYYEVIAPKPSCFFRRYGILSDGTREFVGDFNIADDTPRTIVGDVDCCDACETGSGSESTIETREVCFADGSTGYAVLSISASSTVLLRYEDSIGVTLTGVTPGDCDCPCTT